MVNCSFFRVLLPGYVVKLGIPTGIVNHIVEEKCCTKTATLNDSSGKSWHVDVYANDVENIMLFWGNSWVEFVQMNDLEVGFFLLFDYKGKMVFSFTVYDSSTFEKASEIAHGNDTGNTKNDIRLYTEVMKRGRKKKITQVTKEHENFDCIAPVTMRNDITVNITNDTNICTQFKKRARKKKITEVSDEQKSSDESRYRPKMKSQHSEAESELGTHYKTRNLNKIPRSFGMSMS